MVRERDTNLNVGPNRTEADTHRTGYTINPDFITSRFEGPKIIRSPRRIRSRMEFQDLQDRKGEVF